MAQEPKQPTASFDASKGAPEKQGWIGQHDQEGEAEAKLAGEAWRIEDDDQPTAEDRYFRRELGSEARAEARRAGFVHRWTVRIPTDTGGATRAISTEVCVAGPDGSDLLRIVLHLGRRGPELTTGLHAGTGGWREGALAMENPGDFHDWELAFDGPSRLVNVSIGGRLILAAEIDHRDRGHDLVFGSRATGTGVGEWKSVHFSPGPVGRTLKQPPPVPKSIDILTGGEGGYFSYRIPSLIVAPNGDLLVFCEARKDDFNDDGDIDLVQTRSTDGGATWLPHELIYEEGGNAKIKYGNPTAVVDAETGAIWLATNRDYLTESGSRAGGALVLFRSDDSGKTWSKPIDISGAIRGPEWKHHAFGPGIGIQLSRGPHRGRLVIPANYRESFNKREPSFSHVIYSDDHGVTWKLGGVLGQFTNECQIVEIVEQGRPGLLINMRNHWGRGGVADKSGKRLVSRSLDGGLTWEPEVMDPALPEPPCQASLYRYSFSEGGEKSAIFFINPAGANRSNLTIRLSRDEGRTWAAGQLIVPGSAAYSCMARLPDGRLGIVYEGDYYGRLGFIALSPDWLDP